MPDPSAEWWFTDDVAAYLGIKRATVWRMLYPRPARGQMQPDLPEPDQRFGHTVAWRPQTIVNFTRPGRGHRRSEFQAGSISPQAISSTSSTA